MPDISLTREELKAIIKEALTPPDVSVSKTVPPVSASLNTKDIDTGSVSVIVPTPSSEPTPQVSVHWYESRTFAAMLQTTVLTGLGWLTIALASNKWDDWQIGLLLPIVSNTLILLRDMWSSTITAPAKIMNTNNAPARIPQVSEDK